MTIVQLEYFLAVANHGTLAAANDLGVTLLDRSKKPIVPTEAGELFLGQAKKTLAEFYKSREIINDIKGSLSGTLRLGVVTTISPYLMPAFIPRFIKKCPDIKLRIYDMHVADIVDALSHDKVDIAILAGGESEVKILETDLFDDKLYMYVSPESELYGRKEVFVADIDVEKLLLLSEGNCLRNHALRLCEARKAVDTHFDFVNGSLENLMYTVDRTSFTTIIPGMAIRSIPEWKRDRIIPFGGVDAKRRITMAVAPTYVRESLSNLVEETVSEVAKEELSLSEFLIQ